MKKSLLLLTVMLGLAISAQATEVKFTASEQGYANAEVVQNVDVDDIINVTFDKGTNSNETKYYSSGNALRCYGGNTITITASQGTISKIVFTFGSSDGSNEITSDCEIYDSGTWTGSSERVVFTIGGTSGNRRISVITVTYDVTSTPTSAPTVTGVEDGGVYTSAPTITITPPDCG